MNEQSSEQIAPADADHPQRLRRRNLPRRDEIAERPLSTFTETRERRESVEERLLGLVAFDPYLVETMNGLLDEYALVGVDATRAAVAKAEERTAHRERIAGREEALTGWAALLPAEAALVQAMQHLHSLASNVGTEPKKATVDKAMARLTGAIDAVVRHRIDTSEPVEALRARIVTLLQAQARGVQATKQKKTAVSRALNNTADKVRHLSFEEGAAAMMNP